MEEDDFIEDPPIMAIPCFQCGKELEGLSLDCNHPSHGTEFVASGHYGSGVHDPMDGTKLAISICDPCLVLGIAAKRVGKYGAAPREKAPYHPPK
jgi:hypothetical protein